MKAKARKSSRSGGGMKSLIRSVEKHPVRTAAIAGGAVLGVVLVRKAVKTAATVATVKAVSNGASDVVRAARKGGSRAKGGRARPKSMA